MPDRKISQFTEVTSPQPTDYIPLVRNGSDPTDENKKIQYSNLIPDATSATPGLITIAGDLSGTYQNPIVSSIHSTPVNVANLNEGTSLVYSGISHSLVYQNLEFAGALLCNSNCQLGGKVFEFLAPQTNLELTIVVGFDINISIGIDSIQVHTWTQTPNTNLTGRVFLTKMTNAGGPFLVTVTSADRWISIFARNPANSNYYQGVCFTVNGNVITLLSFSNK